MNLQGTYLVCGGSDEPAVHILSPAQVQDLHERANIAGDSEKSRALVLRYAFRRDALYAFPASAPQCMAWVAQEYTGTHCALVRGMAATLALGRYAERSQEGDAKPAPVPARRATGSGGGTTVKSPKPAPVSPAAPGGFFAGLSR